MRISIFILSLLLSSQLLAAQVKGVVYNVNNGSPLDDCLITLIQKGKIVQNTRTDFEGVFTIQLTKNKKYTLQVAKSGYKIESVEFTATTSFLENNKSIEVYLKALDLKPTFKEVSDGMEKPIPNPDIMEDIGDLSELPEGYKIIEAQPLKYEETAATNFNVNLNRDAEKTNVNVEVLKETFNKESVGDAIYNEKDKLPSSYYAESNIYYGSGKALLTPAVKEILDGLAENLKINPANKIRLTAYADALQEVKIGDYIAKLRVEEITKYLMKVGVPFERLEVSVIGNKALENGCYADVECDEFEHQQNRKVMIEIIN